jgi:serpin B
MDDSKTGNAPRSQVQNKLLKYCIAVAIVAVAATWGWLWLGRARCESCEKAARHDAERLTAVLQRLANELDDMKCPRPDWKITEAHLRSLVGPYYGWRGGTGKCDVRFRVEGDEIWVCAGKGIRLGDKNIRHIYRVSADLTQLDKDLPPISGPLGGRGFPMVLGGIETCFTESIIEKEDCSFRFRRKPRANINMDAVRACEEKRAKATGRKDNQRTLATNTMNVFAVDMYHKLARDDHNLVFSPFSIFAALAMEYAGARGDTQAQIADVLHANKAGVPFHPTLGSLISDLDCSAASADALLLTANALWGQKGYGFAKEYQDLLRTHYASEIREVDYKADPGQAEQTINQWVEQQTQGKITQMIKGVPEDAGILTGNAIYFNCGWTHKFPKTDTKEDHFFLLDGNKIMAPLMMNLSGFRYMEKGDFQGVELPYSGDEFSMLIFLPGKKDGLLELEKSLTGKGLAGWIGSLEPWPAGVIVFLPRFYIGSRFGLSSTLGDMGMKLAFKRFQADFTGISGPRPAQELLYLTDVIHQAGIDVSEEGTEAWAATMNCKMISGCGGDGDPTKPKVFRADHPFLFMIRHNPSGCILFMGRVTEPQ